MVRMRGLFCPSCLARDRDQATSSESISPASEPSAAAAAAAAVTTTMSDRSSPISRLDDDEVEIEQGEQQLAFLSLENNDGQQHLLSITRDSSQPTNSDSSQHQPIDLPQPSTSRESSSQLQNQPQQPSHRNNSVTNRNRHPNDDNVLGDAELVRPKLSYDIISVREPLARVLAERQRLQRQPTSDHDYNDVYNERGSSCFYEEIAGSTTSSATYDQIDGASNHNYQALQGNAYALINRADQEQPRRIERDVFDRNEENNYDLINGPDYSQPSTSRNVSALESTQAFQQQEEPKSNDANNDDSDVVQPPTQTIPIYSVINKAARVSNLTSNPDDPPQPPPKNFNRHKQPQASTSGTSAPFYEEPKTLSGRFQSKLPNDAQDTSFGNENDEEESPMPPPRPPTTPRYHHQNIFNATHRPLPRPTSESLSSLDNNNCDIASELNSKRTDCDFKPDDNGYEFLRTNYYDDQIDVGYEKINDPDHPCNQPASDNGGYESLQPIYASPAYAGVLEPVNDDDLAE